MLPGRTTSTPRTLDDLVSPALAARLDRMDVVSRKLLAGTMPGERRSKRRGRSVEFDDFRPYAPGDDLRHVDWNSFARLDRLFIKVFREEEDLSLHLILDASASMTAGEPDKLTYAARLTMALAYLGLVNHNRVTLSAFGLPAWPASVRRLAPIRGRPNLRRASDFLLGVLRDARDQTPGSAPPPGAMFESAMRTLAFGRPPRGVTVLLSDFLFEDGLSAGLNFLSPVAGSGEQDAYAVRILTPGETSPGLDAPRGLSGDLRLTDLETGRGIEITVTPRSLAAYRAAFEEHAERLRRACASRGVALTPITTDTTAEDLVLNTLRRGGLLR